jgi:hypothetical protein
MEINRQVIESRGSRKPGQPATDPLQEHSDRGTPRKADSSLTVAGFAGSEWLGMTKL